jgi:hypothetical protein
MRRGLRNCRVDAEVCCPGIWIAGCCFRLGTARCCRYRLTNAPTGTLGMGTDYRAARWLPRYTAVEVISDVPT